MPILLVSFSLLNLAAKTDYVSRSNHMTLQLSIVVPHANMVAASAANGNDYDTKMVLWNETRVVKRSLTANTATSRIVEDGNSLLYLCEYVYAARV